MFEKFEGLSLFHNLKWFIYFFITTLVWVRREKIIFSPHPHQSPLWEEKIFKIFSHIVFTVEPNKKQKNT